MPGTTPRPEVDLVVNTFERSYRKVLRPGFFPSITNQNRFSFRRRVARINNVDDMNDAVHKAEDLVEGGELDEFHIVAHRLKDALATTGLRKQDLGPVVHYSDCALVAVTLPGSPWLLYWDASIQLATEVDWISRSIELMEKDERIAVTNPNWTKPTLQRDAGGARRLLDRLRIQRCRLLDTPY